MQGGFFGTGRAVVLALILCAAVLTTWRGTWDVADRRVAIASGILVGWAGLNAAARGSWTEAGPISTTVLAFTLTLLVARRLSLDERWVASMGSVAVGLVLATAGWWGVATHAQPWAATEGSLWRSAAGTTYWNATAAILVMLAMVALTWCAQDVSAGPPAVAAAVLLAGAGATLSRAGAAAAVAGIACLCLVGGTRALRAAVPPIVGAGLIVLGLAPSIPASNPPNLAAAVLGAGAGVGLTVMLTRRMPPVLTRRTALAALTGAVVLGAVIIPTVASRMTLASPRWDIWQAALGTVAEHPLTGVGPGRLILAWRDAAGVAHGTTLVHNEWLQLLGELGIIGVCLVAALAVVVMQPVIGGRHGPQAPAALAGLAAATSFLVASTFDFLWHLVAVPVVLALILGCAAPVRAQSSPEEIPSDFPVPVPQPDPATSNPTERSRP